MFIVRNMNFCELLTLASLKHTQSSAKQRNEGHCFSTSASLLRDLSFVVHSEADENFPFCSSIDTIVAAEFYSRKWTRKGGQYRPYPLRQPFFFFFVCIDVIFSFPLPEHFYTIQRIENERIIFNHFVFVQIRECINVYSGI